MIKGIFNFFKKLNARALNNRRLPQRAPWHLSAWVANWNIWSTTKAIEEGLKSNVWVYRCNKILADNSAMALWQVEQKSGDEWKRVEGHPIEILLKKPKPKFSGQDLFQTTSYHLNLGGNALWHMVKYKGVPIELYPLMPDKIKPILDDKDNVLGYAYKPYEGKLINVPADEILHFMFIDPSDLTWGLAPLQAAAKTVDTDNEAVTWNKIALQNRAIADGVFLFKHPLTDDQWAKARDQVREQHQGVKNARTPWVLGADADWKQMSMSPAEMDFIQSRNVNMYEIHAAFGVDPLVTGAPERSGRANKKEAKRALWEDTIIPYLDDLKSALNLCLIPYWDPQAAIPGNEPTLRIVYDLTNIAALKELMFDKAKTAALLSRTGFPLNAINKRLDLGFPEIEGGDEPFLNIGGNSQIPGATASIPARIEHKQETKWTEEYKTMRWKVVDADRIQWEKRMRIENSKLFNKEKRDVVNAYESGGRKAAINAIDEKRWKTLLNATYLAVAPYFGQLTIDELLNQKNIKPRNLKQTFDEQNARVTAWAGKNSAKRAVDVTDTTKDVINNVIVSGIDEGLTTATISKNITGQYNRWANAKDSDLDLIRAGTIARTEVLLASSFGEFEGATQTADELDAELVKTWIDSRDGEVRKSHQRVNGGKLIPAEDRFDNGLLYPGDESAPAGEVVNCRCDTGYEVLS